MSTTKPPLEMEDAATTNASGPKLNRSARRGMKKETTKLMRRLTKMKSAEDKLKQKLKRKVAEYVAPPVAE